MFIILPSILEYLLAAGMFEKQRNWVSYEEFALCLKKADGGERALYFILYGLFRFLKALLILKFLSLWPMNFCYASNCFNTKSSKDVIVRGARRTLFF